MSVTVLIFNLQLFDASVKSVDCERIISRKRHISDILFLSDIRRLTILAQDVLFLCVCDVRRQQPPLIGRQSTIPVFTVLLCISANNIQACRRPRIFDVLQAVFVKYCSHRAVECAARIRLTCYNVRVYFSFK